MKEPDEPDYDNDFDRHRAIIFTAFDVHLMARVKNIASRSGVGTANEGDFAHLVFLEMLNGRRRYVDCDHARAEAQNYARSRVKDFFDAGPNGRPHYGIEEVQLIDAGSPENSTIAKQVIERLREQLSEPEKQLLSLFFEQGFTAPEISKKLEIAEAEVRVGIARIRRLAKRISGQ